MSRHQVNSIFSSDHRGIVLLGTIIILLTFALMGMSLIALLFTVNSSSQNIADQTKAMYLAEAGIVYGISMFRKQGHMDGERRKDTEEEIGPIRLGEGTFRIIVDFAESRINSIGEVNEVERELLFSFRPF